MKPKPSPKPSQRQELGFEDGPGNYTLRKQMLKKYQELGVEKKFFSSVDVADHHYTTFCKRADKSTAIKRVHHITRFRDLHHGSHKRVELVRWLEVWEGWTEQGEKLPAVSIMMGVDETCDFVPVFNGDGNKDFKPVNIRTVYTEEWNPTKFDEILNKYPDTDRETVELTIDFGSRGYGAFTEEEFRNCEFLELKERGRLGVAGVYGSDTSFLKMEPGQRETIEKARGVK